jgi:hypothetical protein
MKHWWLVGLIVLAACGSPQPATLEVGGASASARLVEVIGLLEVAEEPRRQNYDRNAFNHWVDTNGSGCTARQDVLLSQAVGLVQRDQFRPCVIVEGDWYLPFDGQTYSGSPSEIDVDHVVALAEAWDSGADRWDTKRRELFANDHLNLLVSDRQVNRTKGDKDAGEWRPDQRSSWCQTATMMALTKLRYDLSIDTRERRGLVEMANACNRDDQIRVGLVPLPGTADFDELVLAILDERARPS